MTSEGRLLPLTVDSRASAQGPGCVKSISEK